MSEHEVAKSRIDILLDTVEWQPVVKPADFVDDGLPYPTHEGKLRIGAHVLDVVVLNTGVRLITAESLERFFGVP